MVAKKQIFDAFLQFVKKLQDINAPGNKKKFIDKKNAVTFSVVSRSQRDPQLLAGNSENVLLPTQIHKPKKPAERLDEQHKYGIYYDDEYDYLQHLKDVDELNDVEILDRCRISANKDKPLSDTALSKLQLPSSVFGSEVETKVGLLNRAAPLKGPQLDWDPDVVAGLDVDFNYEDPENVLEDDFIAMAEGTLDVGEPELREEINDLFEDEDNAVVFHVKSLAKHKSKNNQLSMRSENDDDDEDDDDDNDSDFSSEDSESVDGKAKTALTSYSMSSSVMPRNAGLTLLDDRFEKFAEQYCEDDIGDLAHEEIEGFIRTDSERVDLLVSQFEKRHKQISLKDFIMKAADQFDTRNTKEDMVDMVIETPAEKWDCETILSTRSTLYNRPKVIKEQRLEKPVRLTKHTEIPDDVLNLRGPTKRQLNRENNVVPDVQPMQLRVKGESLEEKKARKQAVRDIRRVRREQKTATKQLFQEEKLKREKEIVNVQLNIQAVRIT